VARLTQDQVVQGLVARGVPAHVAQGVALNFRDESAFNTGIQELNPHNGRGGYGLAQWTGPRRVALENFAASQNRPADDPDLQLDYFMSENAGPEAQAWQKVMAATTPQEAAATFVNEWERPAAQHAAARTAKYQGVGGAGVSVSDPNPNRTTPWHGPAEVDPSRQGSAIADALMARGAEKKGLGATAADAFANINWGGNALPKAALPAAPAAAARVDAPEVPPVIAAADPARRQELATILARLNSGKLFT
jgi:Phage tail lysozyme